VVNPTLGSNAYSVTCTGPTGCTGTASLILTGINPGQPILTLTKRVSKSRATLGEVISYTVTLTNTGVVAATAVVVSDTFSVGVALVPGSASASLGSFTPGLNGGTWAINSLTAGATATLTFSANLTRDGVVFNTASIPGQEAKVCTTVPMTVCQGQPFAIRLTAQPGYDRYQWLLTAPGATTATQVADGTLNTFTATQVGEYQVVGSTLNGLTTCPDGACCPIVIEERPALVLPGIATQSASCSGVSALTANADGRIILSTTALSGLTYNIAKGSSFTASAPLFGSAQTLPTQQGATLATGLTNPGTVGGDSYTVRIYQGDCFVDVVVILTPINCACPPIQCVPITIQKIR
jgi:uncharacterized repeat protein (TIGR01451 family)